MRSTHYRRIRYPLPARCRHYDTIKDAALWSGMQFNRDILSGDTTTEDAERDTERCTKNVVLQTIFSSSTPQVITTPASPSENNENFVKKEKKKKSAIGTDFSDKHESSDIKEYLEVPDVGIETVSNLWKDGIYDTLVDHLKRSVVLQRNLVQKHVHLKNKYDEYRKERWANEGIELPSESSYPDPPVVEMEMRLGRLVPNSDSKQHQQYQQDNNSQQRNQHHHHTVFRKSLIANACRPNVDQTSIMTPAIVDPKAYTFRGGFDIIGQCDDFFTMPGVAIDALHAPPLEVSDVKANGVRVSSKKETKESLSSKKASTNGKKDRLLNLSASPEPPITPIHSSVSSDTTNNGVVGSWSQKFRELRMNQRDFLWRHRCTAAAYNPALRELKNDEPIYYLLREYPNKFFPYIRAIDSGVWRKIGIKGKQIMMERNKPRYLIYQECFRNSPAWYFEPHMQKKELMKNNTSDEHDIVPQSTNTLTTATTESHKDLDDFIQEMRRSHGIETDTDANIDNGDISQQNVVESKPTYSFSPFLRYADGTEVTPQVGQFSIVHDQTITAAVRRQTISQMEIDSNENIDPEIVASLVDEVYNRQKQFSSVLSELALVETSPNKNSFLTPVSKLHLSDSCVLKVIRDMLFPNSDGSLNPDDEFVTSIRELKNKHSPSDSGSDQAIQPPLSWERMGTLQYPLTNTSSNMSSAHTHVEVPLIYDVAKATTFEMHAFTTDGYRIEFTQGFPSKSFQNCTQELDGSVIGVQQNTTFKSRALVSPLVCLSKEKTPSDSHSIADQPRLKWLPITRDALSMHNVTSYFHGDYLVMTARRASIAALMSKLKFGLSSVSSSMSAISELWEAAKEKASSAATGVRSGLERDNYTTAELPKKSFGFGHDGPKPMIDAPFSLSEKKEALSDIKKGTRVKSPKQKNCSIDGVPKHDKNITQVRSGLPTVSISNEPISEATNLNSLYYTPDVYYDMCCTQEIVFTNPVVRSKSKISQVDFAMPSWCGDARLSVAVERSTDQENGTPYPSPSTMLIGSTMASLISQSLVNHESFSSFGDLSYDSLEEKLKRNLTVVRMRKRMHFRFLRKAVRSASQDLNQLLPKTNKGKKIRLNDNDKKIKMSKNTGDESHLMDYLLSDGHMSTTGSVWSGNTNMQYETVLNYFKPFLTPPNPSEVSNTGRLFRSPTLGEYTLRNDIISDNFLKLCMTDVYTDEVQRVVSRHKQAYDSAKSRSLKSGVPKSSAVADTQNDDYGDEESGTDNAEINEDNLEGKAGAKEWNGQQLKSFNEVKKGCTRGFMVMRANRSNRKTREVEVEIDIPRLTAMLDKAKLALDKELVNLFQIKEKRGNRASALDVSTTSDKERVCKILEDRHAVMVDQLMEVIVRSMLDSLGSISKLP